MVNRLDLRTMLRRKLEDMGENPLWDDATLNDVLADAVAQYGTRFPVETTVALAVLDGDRTVPIVASYEPYRVVRVRDSNGDPVMHARTESDAGYGTEQSWRSWNDALWLAGGAIGGNWEVDYLATRVLPDNDVDEVDVAAGDLEIIVLLAVAGALMRRSVEQGKRGLERAGLALAKVAEMQAREAERMMSARRRRIVGGWIS